MSVSLLHRYNSTAGAIPTTSALKVREIGINTADGILYVQTSAGVIKAINPALGFAPQSVSVDFGQIPVNAANFTITVSGVAVGMNVDCSVSGITQNSAFPDELEMEPVVAYGQVTATNTIMFSVVSTDLSLLTVGKKTINFYVG